MKEHNNKVNITWEKYDCVDNGNRTLDCKEQISGYDWEPYTESYQKQIRKGQVIEPGTYEWTVKVNRPVNQHVDLIITTKDDGDLTEWVWFNTSFNKKQPINVSSETFTSKQNYQQFFNITYDSDMQPDFDDLRFINATETGSENINSI